MTTDLMDPMTTDPTTTDPDSTTTDLDPMTTDPGPTATDPEPFVFKTYAQSDPEVHLKRLLKKKK